MPHWPILRGVAAGWRWCWATTKATVTGCRAWWARPASRRQAGSAASELRNYGIAAQIIAELGIRRMQVFGAPKRLHALDGFGLEITEYVVPGEDAGHRDYSESAQ